MTSPILIIGAGQAGLKAAETLRQKGYDDDIVMIGEEPCLPYQRPPLSKAYLKGELDEERLFLRPKAYFETAEIELISGTSVVSIDPASRKVELGDGSQISYSALVLATGTRARQIPLQGADLENVHSLRTIADVAAIRQSMEAASDIVILGGGYIGMEFAAVAAKLGKAVSVVEARPRIMERSVAPEISGYFQLLHRENGVRLLLGQGVSHLAGTGAVSSVVLAGGTGIPADLVLLAVGAEPVTELAREAGLKVGAGISVDAFGRTSADSIYAAGDCTEFPSARYGRTIRLESVQNAIDQAKSVAGTILGEVTAYDPVPWFWSDQYDAKLQIAGLSGGYDRSEIEGDPASGSFAMRYFRGSRLVAVDTVNAPRIHMLARRELQATPPPPISGASERSPRAAAG